MSQSAIALTKLGARFELIQRPIPEPKENEALLKVESAGLNPHDQKVRDSGRFVEEEHLPYVPANDVTGTVVKAGPGVSLRPGDRIVAQAEIRRADCGGLQQYAIVDEDLSAVIPSQFSFDEAATIPTNAMAVFVALFHSTGLGLHAPDENGSSEYKDQSILIVGGGSNCGKMAVQFARLAGFGKIVVIASKTPEKEALLKDLGATHVVHRLGQPGEKVFEIVGDDLIYAIDCVNGGEGSQTISASLLSDSKRGTLATLMRGSAHEAVLKGKAAGYEVKFIFGSGHIHRELGKLFWKHLPQWMESGKIRPLEWRAMAGLDADEVNRVLDAYRDGEAVTQPHVHPNRSS